MSTERAPKASGLGYLFLTVSDVATSVTFYRDTLGFEIVVDGTPEFAFARIPGSSRPQLGLYRASAADPTPSRGRLLAIDVQSVQDWHRHLTAAGCAPSDVEDVPAGRVVRFDDPDGNHLEVHEPAAR